MKKIMSLVMAILLLCLSLPTTVEASSQSYSQRRVFTEAEVRQKIAEVFPNYLDEMQEAATFQTQNNSQDSQDDINIQLVDYDVRSLSDNERVTRLAYSNGRAYYVYNIDTYTNSSSSGTGYLRVNTDVYLNVIGYMGMLQVFGFEYTLVQNGYDSISSFGSATGSWSNVTIYRGLSTETATQPAYGVYTGQFEDNFNNLPTTISLQINVGGDSCTFDVY